MFYHYISFATVLNLTTFRKTRPYSLHTILTKHNCNTLVDVLKVPYSVSKLKHFDVHQAHWK